MTWDEIKYFEGYKGPRLSASDMGCGCCANGITVSDPVEAVELLRTHAVELRERADYVEAWAKRIEREGKIVKDE